ncbi:MAG TPA: GWxTD domain-containing protein [Bacteroidota bacterium]|nr:GWxTD domain-containing protein [Bacteroidota bacterium]
MKSVLLAFLAFLQIPGSAVSQIRSGIPGRGDFQISADISRYYGDSLQAYVELAYAVRENSLTYDLDSGRYVGTANFTLTVRTDSGIVLRREWRVPHVLADSERMHGVQQLIGLEGFAVRRGVYSVVLNAVDALQPRRGDSLTLPLTIDFTAGKPAISDIEFCTTIEQSENRRSPFYKNTLEVIPNPARLYGSGLPIIYYYMELYNIGGGADQSPVKLHTAVVDVAGREMTSKDKPKQRSHNASVEIGTMNIGTVRSGTYYFTATLIDTGNRVLAQSSKKFYVYKPGSRPDSTLAGGREPLSFLQFYGMTDTAVILEFHEASYLATEQEKEQFNQLTDLHARQKFLAEFWDRRSTDSTRQTNPYRDEYLRRVDYAVNSYGTPGTPGWRTDRGRVYIMYGPPNDIEHFASTQDAAPYEIWHYDDQQGGIIFVFVDETGLSNFQLVHSTARTEFQDENWFEDYAHKAK